MKDPALLEGLPQPEVPMFLSVRCPFCGSSVGDPCSSRENGIERKWVHRSRHEAFKHRFRSSKSRYVIIEDDQDFHLFRGDIVVTIPYPYDAKVTVLYRESDRYDPQCNQYLSNVLWLGWKED